MFHRTPGNQSALQVEFSPVSARKLEKKVSTHRKFFRYAPYNERSAPIVWNDLLVVGSSDKYVYGMDLAKRKVRWQFRARGKVEISPATDGQKVIVGDTEGIVYCLRLGDGEMLWKFPTRAEVLSSPTIVDDVVYIASADGRLFALGVEDGEFLWKYRRAYERHITIRGFSTPAYADGIIYEGFSDGSVVALDAVKGTEQWSTSLNVKKGDFIDIDSSPVVSGDYLFIASYDGNLYCLKRNTGEALWQYPGGGTSTASVADGKVFFTTLSREVIALARETGFLVWKKRIGEDEDEEEEQGLPTSPLIIGDVLVVGFSGEHLYGFDAVTGEKIWVEKIKKGISADSIFANKSLFVFSNKGRLYQFEPSS